MLAAGCLRPGRAIIAIPLEQGQSTCCPSHREGCKVTAEKSIKTKALLALLALLARVSTSQEKSHWFIHLDSALIPLVSLPSKLVLFNIMSSIRLRPVTVLFLAGSCLSAGVGFGLAGPALASGGPSLGISCQMVDGVPTTVSQTKRKRVEIIRWESDAFSSAGYTPARRCQEVSRRFEAYRAEGRLKYLTTGRVNGQNVICVADRHGGPCTGSLYTLKPGQNPSETLTSLLNVRRGVSGPLPESPGRVWIKFTDLLSRKSGESLQLKPAKSAVPDASRPAANRSAPESSEGSF